MTDVKNLPPALRDEVEQRLADTAEAESRRAHLDALRTERAGMVQRLGRLRAVPPSTAFIERDTTGCSPTGLIVSSMKVKDLIADEEVNLADLDKLIAEAEAETS
jgi:hypothetical protein